MVSAVSGGAGPDLKQIQEGVRFDFVPVAQMQGPTSTGKTSLVAHLAAQTGHRCVRINNHEQTDLQVRLLRLPPASCFTGMPCISNA